MTDGLHIKPPPHPYSRPWGTDDPRPVQSTEALLAKAALLCPEVTSHAVMGRYSAPGFRCRWCERYLEASRRGRGYPNPLRFVP